MNFNALTGYWKAHVAAVTAAYAVLQADIAANTVHTLAALSGNQWIGIIAALVGVGGAVALVPNQIPAEPVTSLAPEQDDGAEVSA